jgi:phage shock protein C
MNGNKKLTRSTSDRWIAGVCTGIANYFGWDVAIFRLVYLLLTVCTAFCGVVAYIILWICMPEDNEYNHL